MRQLGLGIALDVALRFETFHPGPNAEALAAARRRAEGAGRPPLWLWGPPGSGRTHLCQAACALAGEAGRTAAFLPLTDVRAEDPGLLEGYEQVGLVALDDLDAVAGDASWERALFALCNGVAEQGGGLIVTAAAAPGASGFRLPDLASRLAAFEVHRLKPLPEADQARALHKRAALRGLELPAETSAYLMRRAPRDFATLCRMLDALDAEALAAQRRLTVPFVRAWLEAPRHPAQKPRG